MDRSHHHKYVIIIKIITTITTTVVITQRHAACVSANGVTETERERAERAHDDPNNAPLDASLDPSLALDIFYCLVYLSIQNNDDDDGH